MRNRVRVVDRVPEDVAYALTAQSRAAFAGSGSGPVVPTRIAEFVQKSQGTNVSIAPGSAVSYTADQGPVVDTIGIVTAPGPGGQGTAFRLPAGTYLVDWENSNDAAWSLAIYKGPSVGGLAIDTNTIVGSTTATTWIHGRAVFVATDANPWMMISPVTGTHAIPTAGTAAGEFIARINFARAA